MMDWSVCVKGSPDSAADAPACASITSILKASCSAWDMWDVAVVSKGLR